MGDGHVHLTSKNSPQNIDIGTESNFHSSDVATSGDPNDREDILVCKNTPRDWNTSSNFGSGHMSDSPLPQHIHTQRLSTAHSTQSSTTHAHSLPPSPQVPSQHRLPTNFSVPSPHAYIGHPMSPPIGPVHSPPLYGFSNTYRSPMVPDSTIPQNLHAHYQSLSPHPHVAPLYHHQLPFREGNSALPPSFSGTGPIPLYPTHQANALGPPTSPHLTPPTAHNSPLSPSYMGSGAFRSLQYPSPMLTPHYTYSPPFPGTPTYQTQYPSPQFGQRYTANRDSEPQGDWYYVPRRSSVAPSQQYDATPSYSGHYPTTYPQVRPAFDDTYNAHSFSSANFSTPHLIPHIRPFSQHPETPSSEIPSGPPMSHAVSLSSGSEYVRGDKPIVRQPYHPNPPPHRSEWVMWVGNIPSDATHDEVYRFFTQVPEDRISGPTASMGVVSVFLISRSNCAFVNFESENYLLEAISRFDGVLLRAGDARCARLVCRVRRRDDDLKAGVGGQRGTGMHMRWVKEQNQAQEKTKHDQSDLSMSDQFLASPSSISEQLADGILNLSLNDNSESGHVKHSSTSGSYSSSNSSFLARHFPKRYFILKSLTQHDLDLSVQTGFWATQKHNEGILDQSYRTSKDVYLIFGVNKSGEFYGYARMAGPVRRGGQNIHWAPSPPRSNQSSISGRLSSHSSGPNYFSPEDHRLVDSSPLSVDTDLRLGQQYPPCNHPHSAPGMIGRKYELPTLKTPEMKYSLDQQQTRLNVKNLPPTRNDDFELDPSAPVRAMRSTRGRSGSRGTSLHSLEEVEERVEEPGEVAVDIQEPTFSHEHEEQEHDEDSWGECFAVEWISTDKLSFNHTRHIRNPWNHDREVKISRDGTELEPGAGQKLLDEWHKHAEPPQQQQHSLTSAGRVGSQVSGHGGASKSAGSSSRRLVPQRSIDQLERVRNEKRQAELVP